MAETQTQDRTPTSAHQGSEHAHPGPGQYVEIALILAALTTVEVLLYVFREPIGPRITTPALLILTIFKFALVGLWFMHLRFDHRLFRRVFVSGIVLALVVFAIVGANFYLGPGGPGF